MDSASLYGELLSLMPGRVQANEPLNRHTSWQIGGPADLFVEPAGRRELQTAVFFAREWGIPLTVIGYGTNLLVSDRGVRGIVVKIGPKLGRITVRGTELVAEAGARLARVTAAAFRAGLSGFAFSAGIPGAVGGAVVMNAGAFGHSIGEVVRNVLILSSDGNFSDKTREEMGFSYRSSILQREPAIVVEASFTLQDGAPEQIRREMKECLDRRKQLHPLALPNAGSVFKNPHGHSAGQLIEASGLKGLTIGGARISLKHANFIVNQGTATARDVALLIDRTVLTVRERFGIELQPEVKFIGDW